jgi:sialate O-acetylesterase
VKNAKAAGKPLPRKPRDPATLQLKKGNVGGLFNGKIAPLIPFGLRGVLWYQGEANSTPIKAPYYQYQLPLLVTDWRARWGEELPFAWVHLPNFISRGDGWCLVREAMLKTLKLPKTGMAVTLDIGDPKNIHPTNKQEVGRRLAQWALGTIYDKKVETSGPLPAKHEVKDGAIIVSFTHADGLTAKGGELKEFVIAGEDKQWQPAMARIEDGKVIVSSDAVPKPVAVRYAWKDNPEATLFNGAGIPATQFRTDNWPIVFPDLDEIRRKALEDRAAKNAARAKAKGKGNPAKAGTEAKADANPKP